MLALVLSVLKEEELGHLFGAVIFRQIYSTSPSPHEDGAVEEVLVALLVLVVPRRCEASDCSAVELEVEALAAFGLA